MPRAEAAASAPARRQGREAEAARLEARDHLLQHIGIGVAARADAPMHHQHLPVADGRERAPRLRRAGRPESGRLFRGRLHLFGRRQVSDADFHAETDSRHESSSTGQRHHRNFDGMVVEPGRARGRGGGQAQRAGPGNVPRQWRADIGLLRRALGQSADAAEATQVAAGRQCAAAVPAAPGHAPVALVPGVPAGMPAFATGAQCARPGGSGRRHRRCPHDR